MSAGIEELRNALFKDKISIALEMPAKRKFFQAYNKENYGLTREAFQHALKDFQTRRVVDPKTKHIKEGRKTQILNVEQAEALLGLIVYSGMSTGTVSGSSAFRAIVWDAGLRIERYFDRPVLSTADRALESDEAVEQPTPRTGWQSFKLNILRFCERSLSC